MSDAVITLDIDWAPDPAIDFVTERLVQNGVRATWFVTHLSPAISRLRQYPELFELGIHPNFNLASTHGDTPAQVLRHCMTLVPDAVSMRTHGLVQSSLLLDQVLAETAIKTDVSLFLPHAPFLYPVEHWSRGRMLLRIPYYWEDDLEMEFTKPCWQLRPLLSPRDGLKVFAFHPIFIYLNSRNSSAYQLIKRLGHRLFERTQADLDPHTQEGVGAQTLFMELVAHLAATGRSSCIRDIYDRWTSERKRISGREAELAALRETSLAQGFDHEACQTRAGQ